MLLPVRFAAPPDLLAPEPIGAPLVFSAFIKSAVEKTLSCTAVIPFATTIPDALAYSTIKGTFETNRWEHTGTGLLLEQCVRIEALPLEHTAKSLQRFDLNLAIPLAGQANFLADFFEGTAVVAQ